MFRLVVQLGGDRALTVTDNTVDDINPALPILRDIP